MSDDLERARSDAKKHGFALLFASALTGFCLELAHAFKLASYLDVPLRRELLTWAHAHGVGLALVLIAYASAGVVDARSARQERTLFGGALGMPLGFALGSVGLHESDPGVGIVLVPVGALLVLKALFVTARSAWRR